MTDRLVIEITGNLPDEDKYEDRYVVLADATAKARKLAMDLQDEHKIELTATVRSVRPGKGKGSNVTALKAAE